MSLQCHWSLASALSTYLFLCLTIQRGAISLDSKCKLLNACLLASILIDNFYSTDFLFIVLINVQKFLVFNLLEIFLNMRSRTRVTKYPRFPIL